MNVKQYKEIVDTYNKIGDWLLSFSLAAYTDYDKEYLLKILI